MSKAAADASKQIQKNNRKISNTKKVSCKMCQTAVQEEKLQRQPEYVCVNCGHAVQELYKKYSNTSIKTIHCEQCHKIVDKYIEFELIIILVDAMLLSQESYRHMIHNRCFKLQWKLSLVLLLLEAFALWRQKRDDNKQLELFEDETVTVKGFYMCCLQNIIDYLITTMLLLLITCVHRIALIRRSGVWRYTLVLLKAITIANFSKIFLLPIMVWRENTTDLGAYIHHLLVLGHHLFALVYIYAAVGHLGKIRAALIVLPAYVAKQYIKQHLSIYIEQYFKLK